MSITHRTKRIIVSACKALCISIFSLATLSCSWFTDVQASEPVICFTFDDQHMNVYEQALPIMEEYGYKGTNFINSGSIGLTPLMNWDQIVAMEMEYGWETGGHTLYHQDLVDLNYAEAEAAIALDYQNLRSHGLDPRGFALPKGSCPIEYYDIITSYYEYIRAASDFTMQTPVNKLSVGYLPFQSGWTAEHIKARIDRGIANGEALIVIGFHRIGSTASNVYDNCPADQFRLIMEYVHAKGLTVKTLAQALEHL